MTRTLTTAPAPTTVGSLRPAWRFRALIAVIVAATVGLIVWTGVQQRAVDTSVTTMPAPVHQSVRQIERADQVRAERQHLDDIEVRRFGNQVDAAAPVRPDAQRLDGLEEGELRRFRNRVDTPDDAHPGLQP